MQKITRKISELLLHLAYLIFNKISKNKLDSNNVSYKRLDFDDNKVIYFLTGTS